MFNPPSGWSLSALSIRRHIATLTLAVAAIVLGGFFVSTMQVDLLPAITYPRIGLRADAPGLAPEVAIDEVTRPLEEALSATEGVVQVYSQTREGSISLDLYFQPGGNLDRALNDATAAFNRARGRLPDVVDNARLFKIDPSQLPVYELAIAAPNRSPAELRVLAEEEMARELNVVDGVASVNVSGGVEEEVRVTLDLQRIQAIGLDISTVLDGLRDRNQDISGGRIYTPDSEPLTRATGRFRSADDIAQLPFVVRSGQNGAATQTVRLQEVAEVVDGTAEQRVLVQLNGQPAVKLSIQKQQESNTIAVVEGVKERLARLQANGTIPSDITLVTTLDESVFIQDAISNVVSSGLVGTGLAAIAVFFFLGSLRQTFIVTLSIPLATLIAVIAMRLCGLTINIFSLGGLALGVGIVVDNSIVMMEAIVEGTRSPGRTVEPAETIDRAIVSSQAVESALIASTSTNLVAVLPFLAIGGFIALLFNELILTISFSVAASILVAATVVPALAARLLAIPQSSGVNRTWLLREFDRRVDGLMYLYGRSLRALMPWRLVVVAVISIVLTGSSLWAIGGIPQEILPRIATGQVQLTAQFPPGTTLVANRRVMDRVDEILLKQPETVYAFTTIGGSLFGSNTTENPLRSSSTISLKPNSDPEEFIQRVNRQLKRLNLVDVRLRLRPGEVRGLILNNSPVRGAEVDVILQGRDPEVLAAASRQVLAALDEQATQASFRPDADRPQPELKIRPDPARLADLDLDVTDVGQAIETAIQGSVPTQLQRGDRLVDVRVRLDRTQVSQPSQLLELPLFAGNGQLVQLGEVAAIEPGRAPSEIQRIDRRPVALIAGNLNAGASLSDAIAEVDRVLAGLSLPEGVTRLPSAAATSNQQIQAALPVLGGLATFLVFVVMAVQYNSLIDPLAILFAIPLAVAGGILGLYVTQTAIGATAVVGGVLLIGIVVNNAIIMVELANQLRERDRITRWEAIVQAAPQRLRPILMTTITTVLGMLPLAMGIGAGSEFLQPLGIAIFSGLSLATVLTLFLIPCLYVLLHDWLRWPFGRSPQAIAPRPTELRDDDAIADPHEGDPAPIPVETSELPSAGDRR
jgi:multidrug efflux pump subunit AcrB